MRGRLVDLLGRIVFWIDDREHGLSPWTLRWWILEVFASAFWILQRLAEVRRW